MLAENRSGFVLFSEDHAQKYFEIWDAIINKLPAGR